MSIVDADHYLFTSESVTEGHPDKMCDQISDAILDAILREDPDARVACETATTTGLVLVLGEISTTTYVDFQTVVRDTVRDIGYTKADYGFDYLTCGTLVSVKEQSGDIAMGVDAALEIRSDAAPARARGAGAQWVRFGFA
jgi:S-adenosylmethionine synthetase